MKFMLKDMRDTVTASMREKKVRKYFEENIVGSKGTKDAVLYRHFGTFIAIVTTEDGNIEDLSDRSSKLADLAGSTFHLYIAKPSLLERVRVLLEKGLSIMEIMEEERNEQLSKRFGFNSKS